MPRRPALDIPAHRLQVQQVGHHRFTRPEEVVSWLGAVQAQDYLASLWAVGLRLPAATATEVERALDDGAVIRTHAMRGTLQLIAGVDARWVLAAVAPRVIAAMAGRLRQLELDATTLGRANEVIARAVEGHHRTRAELGAALAAAGIAPTGQRLIHMLARAELDRVICSGRRRGKQATFAAFDERVPRSRSALDRDAAIIELARRHVRSRGPVTARDVAWWCGLPLTAARTALAALAPELTSVELDGETWWFVEAARAGGTRSPIAHLLPAFDEYLVGYADRRHVLDPAHAREVNAGGGMLNPSIVVDGRVVGTWRRTLGRTAVTIELAPFRPWSRPVAAAVTAAAFAYGEFLGLEPKFGP